ncbi:MAG: metal ABC transporter solute-binding protein, Zn/Mn family, partial [Selenomonas artemidis]
MQHKKSFAYVLLACCFLLVSLVGGCGGTSADKPAGDKSAAKKTVTVTTSFLQDMTKQLAGDYVNIELIIPAGEDPHLYVAQPAD